MSERAYPETYRALRRSQGAYPLHLEYTTEHLPDVLGATDVVVKVRAASLNYRDIAMMREGKCVVPSLFLFLFLFLLLFSSFPSSPYARLSILDLCFTFSTCRLTPRGDTPSPSRPTGS